jgi:hypothetical protein
MKVSASSAINPSVDSKTHHSNDQFSVPALHTCLREEQRTVGSRMLTEKPLFMVAVLMAVVLTIAVPVMSIF